MTSEASVGEFDLQPDPRVLPMLGEINLDPWSCIAEFVDNSVDGFLNSMRAGVAVDVPQVVVTLPTAVAPNARVQVRDNGPGMAPDVLETAVRAGWTGNNPIDNLGLFGMGFNIATARLGALTKVWTTRSGDPHWHGLQIDFDELRRRKSFKTPHLVRPKSNSNEHGTEITIERIKPDQLTGFARTAAQSRIRDQLSKSYSAMLRKNGVPLSFALNVNGRPLLARQHCVWSEDRFVDLPEVGHVPAVIPFDVSLPLRKYCLNCMRWLGTEETDCGTPNCRVVERARRVHGWIGLQRYIHETDFGFDFIRNGRKIEFGSKDLFDWTVDGVSEREYPLDDPRNRGRFVGEIHLDHCRVHYDKTRFERTDPAWAEMVHVVRGDGPLRPAKARELGYGVNTSPLYRLFQAFRRNSPKQRSGGGWTRLFIVNDQSRAAELTRLFHEGHPEYQDDSKWWELAQEADRKALLGEDESRGTPKPGKPPKGFVDRDDEDDESPGTPEPKPAAPPMPSRIQSPELTRVYEVTGFPRIPVEAFLATRGDSDLRGNPWSIEMISPATRTYRLLFDPTDPVFRSATFTPRDALLSELASLIVDLTRGTGQTMGYSTALAGLRTKYAGADDLDPRQLILDATEAIADMARSIKGRLDPEAGVALLDEFTTEERSAVLLRMAQRGVTTGASLVADGGFLEFVDRPAFTRFFSRHPELFLDGRYWDDPYSSIDLGDAAMNEVARRRVVDRYSTLLADAVWLAEMDARDLSRSSWHELVRASISIRLLRPDVERN